MVGEVFAYAESGGNFLFFKPGAFEHLSPVNQLIEKITTVITHREIADGLLLQSRY